VLYDSPMRDDGGAASVHGDGHESAGGEHALPALTGYAIARERGNTPVRALTVTLIVGAAGLAVVAIKSALAH